MDMGRHNIPSELVTLLRKLGVHDLLDVALGWDGRWYVRYRQKGPERHEMSPSLWADLGQGSNVKLDRLSLGPGATHWGVHRAPDGVFQSFSSVNNRDRFVGLMDSKADISKSSSQIDFVSLGFGGGWAFSVNGCVEYRFGKPFENRLKEGQQARKKVSTIVLSPLARLWIIVWEDGTLSHNLPSNIATEVEDYCQLQHSLKENSKRPKSRRPKSQKEKNPQNNQRGPSASAQTQQSTTDSTQTAHQRSTQNNAQPVTKPAPTQLSTTSIRIAKPVQAIQSTTLAVPRVPLTWQHTNLFSRTSSQLGGTSFGVGAVSTKPYVYAPRRKLSTTLRFLDPSDRQDFAEYNKVACLFENGWKHQHKPLPQIKRILAVSLPDYLNESYDEYKDLLEKQNGWGGVNEQLVFHGTTWSCALGGEEESDSLCEKMTCNLCCILRMSFLVSKAGSAGRGFNRFGAGIYTSSVSSKADDYANAQWYSGNKVMIVAKAALGKGSNHYTTTLQLTGPPLGYDSVLGEVGVHLNYDEQVLYKNEAIRPAYIVIYEQWKRPWNVYDDDY